MRSKRTCFRSAARESFSTVGTGTGVRWRCVINVRLKACRGSHSYRDDRGLVWPIKSDRLSDSKDVEKALK